MYVLIALLVVTFLYGLITYNGLIKQKNSVDEAFATMDVYLKRRWDLIPNIVEAVKSYMKHEQATLEAVTSLRTGDYDQLSPEGKLEKGEKLSTGIARLMVMVENYPELKADSQFSELNANLAKVEEDLANSRKYYNAVVRDFNNKVQMFPSNLVARLFGIKTITMFEIEDLERQNVKVKI